MSTSDECCGWLGWAELAGMGADGSRLQDSAPAEQASPSTAAMPQNLPFITAVLRRALHGRHGLTR